MARTEASALDDVSLPKDVRRAVDIDLDELRNELARTPADVGRANALAADLHGQWRRLKAARERILGEVLSDPDLANALKEKLGKAPNADQLKAAAVGSKAYLEALEAEIDADVAKRRAGGYSSALREKAALLVSIVKLASRERYGHDEEDEDEDEEKEDEEDDDEQ